MVKPTRTKPDLRTAASTTVASVVRRAVLLGVRDQRAYRRDRSATEILETLTAGSLVGHREALVAAYRLGRFHVAIEKAAS